MTDAVYLDHNATTPVRPEAAAAVAAALTATGNPSSVHGFGRAAREVVETARAQVGELIDAPAANVIFTSGGTEANALALHGARRVLASAAEHASVLEFGGAVETVPVDHDGIVDVDALNKLLAGHGADTIVSVMLANNETGSVQPIGAVVETARRHGARVHCDAVQAAGKIAVDAGTLGADLISLSAHKLGGPMGVGALVLGDGVGIEGQPRAGTENLSGIAGFGAAAAAARDRLEDFADLARLRDRLEQRLPAARVYGARTTRLPNTTCLGMPGVTGETQVMALDLAGYAISAGSACSSGKVAPSHVLAAMGVAEEAAAGAIRVSLGWTTKESDIEGFADAWTALYARLGRDADRTAPAA